MSHRVLLVDDNIVLTKSLKRHLEREGMSVTAVPSCRDARKAIEDDGYDLIVTDIRLPDCVGIDLVDEISHVAERPPVLIITGEEREVWERKALALGVEAYLIKPFPIDTMSQTVRCLLDGHCCFPACSKGYQLRDAPENCPLKL